MEIVFLMSLTLVNADFTVCDAAEHQTFPSVDFKNGQYYVFWMDRRTPSLFEVYGSRVTTAGTVLDPDGKLIFSDTVLSMRSASDGVNFLLVWRECC